MIGGQIHAHRQSNSEPMLRTIFILNSFIRTVSEYELYRVEHHMASLYGVEHNMASLYRVEHHMASL